MNKVILIGRLTKDPDVQEKYARYSLAVDRAYKAEGQPDADFISCVVFGKGIEFVEKYMHKGMKICVEGRIMTGSFEKDGVKHYTTDIVVDRHEFVESKKNESSDVAPAAQVEPGNLESLAAAYPGVVQLQEESDPDLPF